MQAFKKLQVWQKAHALTLAVYKLTLSFPNDERYGLISQMRRSSASVPTNLAEGCGRSAAGDFCRFIHIAAGSAHELEYQLILARDLKLVDHNTFDETCEQVQEIQKMLAGLERTLKSRQ